MKCVVFAAVLLLAIVGANAQAFQSVWASSSNAMTCSDSRSTLLTNNVLNMTIAGSSTMYFMGYEQLSANKNPCVARFDGNTQVWCSCDYETTSDEGIAYGALLDRDFNQLYVVFSVNSLQTGSNYDRFTTTGWFSAYGQGGGKQIAVILNLSPSSGVPNGEGTYIRATDGSGNANSVTLTRWEKLSRSRLHVTFDAFDAPLNVDKSRQTCSGVAPFVWVLDLSLDLSLALESSASGCTGNGGQITNSLTSVSSGITPSSLSPVTFSGSPTTLSSLSPLSSFSSGSPSSGSSGSSGSSASSGSSGSGSSSGAGSLTASLSVLAAAFLSLMYFF